MNANRAVVPTAGRRLTRTLIVVAAMMTNGAHGESFTWTGAGNGKWSSGHNWDESCGGFLFPIPCRGGLPGGSDGASIGGGPPAVLDSSEAIGTLSIGADGHLSVSDGSLSIGGQSIFLFASGIPVTIARVPHYASHVATGGVIAGHGTLNFDTHPDADPMELPLRNSGRIAAENGTLTLSSSGSALDLDGVNHTGILDVNDWNSKGEPPDGVTLKVVGQVEPFAGELFIGQADTAEFDSLSLGDESAGAIVQMRPLQTDSDCFGRTNCTATLATTDLRIDHPNTVIHVNNAGFAGAGSSRANFTGNVDFVAGRLNVDNLMTARFENDVTFRVNATTRVDGTVRFASTATIDDGAQFSGNGKLFVEDTGGIDVFSDATVNTMVINNGLIDLHPGNTGAEFTVAMFDQNPSGEIRFDLASPSPSSYDQLHVSDSANLDGTATVSFVGAMPLVAGDEFTLIDTMNGISGQFATWNLPTLDADLEWSTQYSTNSLKLVVTHTTIDGDFDRDGSYTCADINALSAEIIAGSTDANFDLNADGQITLADQDAWLTIAGGLALNSGAPFFTGDLDLDSPVDSTDLGLLLNNFGDTTGMPYCSGNLNADMNIDSTDLGLLLNNFGRDADPTTISAAVPEPRCSFSVLLFFAATLLARLRSLAIVTSNVLGY